MKKTMYRAVAGALCLLTTHASPALAANKPKQDLPELSENPQGWVQMRRGDSVLRDSGDTIEIEGPFDEILLQAAMDECTSNKEPKVKLSLNPATAGPKLDNFCASFWRRYFKDNRPQHKIEIH